MEAQESAGSRDFSTISPSALSLLYLKSLTHIPYAWEAAKVMGAQGNANESISGKEFEFWARVLHFENRYWTIDQLLTDTSVKNIIELSSGYSMRGLDAVRKNGMYYIDTDLPDVIKNKRKLIEAIAPDTITRNDSRLKVLPLNALDAVSFKTLVDELPKGPIGIVNEGLLMYLGISEKQQLCKIIYDVLKEKGGCWITADIYIKRPESSRLLMNDELEKFFKQHHIEENKFDTFEAAKKFFEHNGFIVDKEANPDYSKLVALPHLRNYATPQQSEKLRTMGRMQATWRLKIAD